MKKYLKALWALLSVLLCMTAHAAGSYPSKPIRLIIPYPPGGTTDVIGRVFAEKLGALLGGNIVIDNKAGANSMIGTADAARAAPDGYTLLMTSNVVVINEFAYARPTYHAADLTPIAPIVTTPYFLIVSSKLPINSVADLVKYSKDHPDKLSFGSAGTGGTPHLVGELFKLRTGANLLHVPYKGTGPAVTGLISGDVQVMFVGMPSVEGHVQNGALRVLATAEEKRSTSKPDIPTIAEAGFPGVTAMNWFGLLGPAGLPDDVVKRLSEATAQITRSEDFRKRMETFGAEPMTRTSAEFNALYKSDGDRWRQVIQTNKLKFE